MTKSRLLVIIGGAEDRKEECTILRNFVELSGGKSARIAILAIATEDPLRVEQMYKKVFQRLGVSECYSLHVASRADANRSEVVAQLADTQGIFFTGGDQLRITTMLGGTKLYEALHQHYKDGVVIAGTSAGASVMSEIMIIGGESKKPPAKEDVNLSPGLGLIKGIVIDQHFAQRGRLGRILSVVANNPQILGVGIDENTALVVDTTKGVMQVIGEGAVTVVDGKSIRFSNVASIPANQTLAVSGYLLHTLPDKYYFDLVTRQVINEKKERN